MTNTNHSLAENILIVAGDVSGDLHAANLIREIKTLRPQINITAIGGRLMKQEADSFLFDLAAQGATGFVEPLKKMPLWLNLLKQIRQYMTEQKPCAVIAVDFYGFNHQVLNIASELQIPVFYYVAPQVWASRQYRAKQLARLTQKMFVIYPFEPNFHKKFGGNAVFRGNPLLDIMPEPTEHIYSAEDVKHKEWKLGLLPGSRNSEISRLTPAFYQAFKLILKEFPNTQAYLFALPDADEKKFLALLGEEPHPNFHIIKDKNYELRSRMDFLLACSGTATLENALLGVPMVVAYKMFWPTYQIAKMVIKVKHISLVNILAQKEVVKELIQDKASPEALAQETISMFQNPANLQAQRDELLKLRASLGEKGVAHRAAKEILEDIGKY
ncbi:MAG: lipid-A-disaccharide synthase [Elusimicrobiaceae bacterium]|nr:lipid-A-disaccharide synthase [Elusimicrobiaceae bacterium]